MGSAKRYVSPLVNSCGICSVAAHCQAMRPPSGVLGWRAGSRRPCDHNPRLRIGPRAAPGHTRGDADAGSGLPEFPDDPYEFEDGTEESNRGSRRGLRSPMTHGQTCVESKRRTARTAILAGTQAISNLHQRSYHAYVQAYREHLPHRRSSMSPTVIPPISIGASPATVKIGRAHV